MREARYKIDKVSAEKEFEKICISWDLDNDTDEMNQDDLEDFKELKRKIIRAIRLGRLQYENDVINYTLQRPLESVKRIKIKRPCGNSYLNMDRFKDKETMHKSYAVLSDMTGYPISILSKIDGIDMKVIQGVMILFLAS